MLKKAILGIVVFTLIPVSYAFAGNSAGCGLGTVLLGEQKQSVLIQVLEITTNGISSNQAFGITTGTLGCTNDGIVKNEEKVNVFVAANFENIKEDMARGEGEYLRSLANLMEVPAENQSQFFAMTQSKYSALIKSADTTPQEMLTALNLEMSITL